MFLVHYNFHLQMLLHQHFSLIPLLDVLHTIAVHLLPQVVDQELKLLIFGCLVDDVMERLILSRYLGQVFAADGYFISHFHIGISGSQLLQQAVVYRAFHTPTPL